MTDQIMVKAWMTSRVNKKPGSSTHTHAVKSAVGMIISFWLRINKYTVVVCFTVLDSKPRAF
jgi:hypothetical protein